MFQTNTMNTRIFPAYRANPQLNEMERIKFISENWSIIAALFAALSVAVTFLWKKRKRIGARIKIISYNFVDFVTDKDASTVASIQTSVNELSTFVKYELRPDDGKSFRDAVEETKASMIEAAKEIKKQGHQIQTILAEQLFLTEIDDRGFFKMDLEGNCSIANAKATKVFGADIYAITNKEWWALVHPDDTEALERRWAFAYEKQCEFYSVHRLIIRDTQEIRTVEVNAKPIRLNNKFIGFNCIIKLIKIEPLERYS